MAVHVNALYGHAGLCYMTSEAQPILNGRQMMANSEIHNGLIKPRSPG